MTPTHPAVRSAGRLEQLRRGRPELRRAVLDVCSWALRRGVRLERDALTVVLGTVEDAQRRLGRDPYHWTRERVVEFVWRDCTLWCVEQGTVVPPGSAEALRQFWLYLQATDRFSPSSDEVALLARTLATHAGPPPRPRRGRTARHPPARGPALRA
jgi:hypothetical protein